LSSAIGASSASSQLPTGTGDGKYSDIAFLQVQGK
jgi:hypothetical protein